MVKNMHDVAYELQKAIAEHPDFQSLKVSYGEVQADAEAKELFDRFRMMQMELQQKMMQGEQLTDEDNQKAQEVVALVQQNVKITNLMQAEQRLNVLIGDVNKITMQPLEDLYNAYMPS